jgi:hypothetical protein
MLCAALLSGVADMVFASGPAKADIPDLRQVYLSMDDIPENDYYHYVSRQGNHFYKGEDILCPVRELVGGGELEDGGVRMDPGQTRNFQIQTPEEGLYQIGFQYRTADEDILPGGVAIMVNGEYPFPSPLQFRKGTDGSPSFCEANPFHELINTSIRRKGTENEKHDLQPDISSCENAGWSSRPLYHAIQRMVLPLYHRGSKHLAFPGPGGLDLCGHGQSSKTAEGSVCA